MSDQPIPTPRTDDEVLLDGDGVMLEPTMVLASFARTLERELSVLKATFDQNFQQYNVKLAELQSERDRLKNAIALLEHGKYGRTDMAMQILALETERDQLRRVAGAAWRLLNYTYHHWSVAGGVNECRHGVSEGIFCLRCDQELVNHSKSPTQ